MRAAHEDQIDNQTEDEINQTSTKLMVPIPLLITTGSFYRARCEETS